jgi:DegV family protein with EDD domain
VNKVLILTDSTADLSQGLLIKHDIQSVPLFIRFDEEVYLDGIDITTEELYEKVDEMGMLAKSSGLRTSDFLITFKKYLSRGYDILYIGVSSLLSGSVQAAELARNEVANDRIFIVDSKNLSSGVGLLVLKAKDLRDQGFSAQEIKRKIDQMVPFVKTYFIIPELTYLYMGNHITSTQKFLGNLTKTKPILTIKNGNVEIVKKPSGGILKSITYILKTVDKDKDRFDRDYMMVTHSYATKSANYLKNQIIEKYEFKNIIDSYAGCVISAHIGKGSIGIAYLTK